MNQNSPVSVGQRIAVHRKNSKLTAEELASKVGLGLTRSVLANLESGRKQDLTVSQLIGISAVLGVRPIDLIFDLTEPYERFPLTEGEASLTASTWLAAEWFSSRLSASQMDAKSDGERVDLQNEGQNSVLLEMLRRRWALHDELGPLLHLQDEDTYSDPGLNRMMIRRQQIQSELWELERSLSAAGVKLIEPVGPRS